MPIKILFHAILALFFWSPSLLWADHQVGKRIDIGIAGAVLGDNGIIYGAEMGYLVTPSLRIRLNDSVVSYQSVQILGGLQFDQQVDQNNVRLTLDWFPWEGRGLYGNLGVTLLGDSGKFTVTPTDKRDYKINGVIYSSAQIGSIAGTMETHQTVPYIGIGYLYLFPSTAQAGWYLQMEMGMVSNLEPRLKIQPTHAAAPPQLYSDLQAQADHESEKLPDAYTLYGITIGYRFSTD